MLTSLAMDTGEFQAWYTDQDVMVYSIGPDDKSPQLRMGHVSMITDLVGSPKKEFEKAYPEQTLIHDDSRVVTAERDEKIRITHYPQTHVIDRILFGHKE